MFFHNTLKEREIEHDGVVFVIKPMDCYEQLEYLAVFDEATSAPEKVLKAVKLVLKNNVKDIKGLVDENKEPVDYKSIPPEEFLKGLTVGKSDIILEAVTKTLKLAEDDKKKSSQHQESSAAA